MTSLQKRVFVRIGRLDPVRIVFAGYLLYVLVGWLLLCLPFMWHDEAWRGPLDALFTATSAVSTTGLITVNTPTALTFWGELVVLGLIQMGGLGYMTLGSFVVLAGHHKLNAVRQGVAQAAFALPDGFDARTFVRNVVVFTLVVEAIGAALLFPAFWHAGVAERAAAGEIGASFGGAMHVAWQSVFHAVSAFCTAGFSLFPDSLESYAGDVWVNAVVSALAILGAIGFIVLTDFFRGATKPHYRVTLTSKIILCVTAWFILGGAALLFLGDPSIGELPAEERLMVAFFQSMTAATTVGFNTYPIGSLSLASVLLMYLLMIVGASPSGTGGGLKSTSVSVVFATVRSTLKGRHRITFLGKRIPDRRLFAAFASLAMYVSTLLVGCYLLLLTETRAGGAAGDAGWSFEDLIFEAASALGTVGLSRGLTGDLSDLGKLIIIVLMFAGRVGPMSLGLALFARRGTPAGDGYSEEDVAV